jgi:hypothetical protein
MICARHSSPHLVIFTVSALLFIIWGSGCKHFNDDQVQSSLSLAGTYVGHGTLDNSDRNLVLSITGPDSLNQYLGIIHYHDVSTDFTSVSLDSTKDTLRLTYSRDNVIYHIWSLTGSNGLILHFTQPSDIADIRVNRELDGYNMTGIWNGDMSSTGLGIENGATMTMDQLGQLYAGQVNVSLFQTYAFQINSGTASRAAFQMSGTVRLNSVDYPGYFVGNFVNSDSIYGTWQAGQSVVIDEGYFGFARTYN